MWSGGEVVDILSLSDTRWQLPSVNGVLMAYRRAVEASLSFLRMSTVAKYELPQMTRRGEGSEPRVATF